MSRMILEVSLNGASECPGCGGLEHRADKLCPECQAKSEVNVLLMELAPDSGGPSAPPKPAGPRWWVSQLEFMKMFLVGAKNTQLMFIPKEAAHRVVRRMRQLTEKEGAEHVSA